MMFCKRSKVWYNNHENMKKDFKNILVVRTDRIGDVVLTTPALKSLRQAYPKAKISILVSPAARDLVMGNPCLDEVLVDDRPVKNKSIWGFLKLLYSLKKRKFDLAVIFHTKKRTNLACFLAGIPYRMGYKNDKFGFLLTHPIEDTRHLGQKHETEYCLDVLKHLGVEPGSLELFIPLQKKAEDWAEQFLEDYKVFGNDRLIAIHLGASDPSKEWPGHRFAELINILHSRDKVKVVLIGEEKVQTILDRITVYLDQPIFNAIGKTSVGQLASLLKRCQLLISNDSGPVHIASGVGCPVVSIFTRNQPGINPERWKPLEERSRVVSVKPTQTISFTKAGAADSQYLEPIPIQRVLEAVDALWKLC